MLTVLESRKEFQNKKKVLSVRFGCSVFVFFGAAWAGSNLNPRTRALPSLSRNLCGGGTGMLLLLHVHAVVVAAAAAHLIGDSRRGRAVTMGEAHAHAHAVGAGVAVGVVDAVRPAAAAALVGRTAEAAAAPNPHRVHRPAHVHVGAHVGSSHGGVGARMTVAAPHVRTAVAEGRGGEGALDRRGTASHRHAVRHQHLPALHADPATLTAASAGRARGGAAAAAAASAVGRPIAVAAAVTIGVRRCGALRDGGGTVGARGGTTPTAAARAATAAVAVARRSALFCIRKAHASLCVLLIFVEGGSYSRRMRISR